MNWIFVVFLLLILCSVKKVGRQGGEASVYTKPVSNSIKGVAAILIVLHHIAWKLEEANIIVWFYREINLFAVGIFLFFSGFGLVKSYEAYFTVFLFKLLMDSGSIKIDYSIIKSVLTLQMPPSQLWYLKAQMVCYLLFIISGYFFKEDYHRMALAVFTPILLWTFVSLVLGRGYINMAWYNTLPCFPIGMIVAAEEGKISGIVKKRSVMAILSLTGMVLLLSSAFLFIAKDMIYLFLAVYSVLLYAIFLHFWAVQSTVWDFIGQHSLGIYLIHLLLLDIFQRCQLDVAKGVAVCFLLIGTLAFSVILDALVGKMTRTITVKLERVFTKNKVG